jgi:hypothetical protein
VRRSVEDVEELDERRVEEPALDRLLVEEAERLLDVDDVDRVVERMPWLVADPQVGRPELVPHEAVDEVHRSDHHDLAQPGSGGAQLRPLVLDWHRHECQL